MEILNSNSATGGPIAGSVGNQGWNAFSTTAVAPANAATVNFQLETGAYTGLSGTAGGAVFWDDAQFGPTAANSATLSAANMSNKGVITIGAGDKVAASGTFTQTSTGTLNVQLGGSPASGLYGSLSSAGKATLAGTLGATLVNGYSPSVNDGFNVVTYPSVSGTFATRKLPSGTTYSFSAPVNPTYVGLGAVPPQLTTTVTAGTVIGPVATNMLGVNLAWWDDQLTTSQTQQMVKAAGLTTFRFPGGSSSDDYHFNVAGNYGDPSAITIPQFAEFISNVGGTGLVTLDYGSGSPQEAAAELAYLEGSPSDTTVIGSGLEWNDSTNQWQQVNWQTVGYWASLRAATPLAQDDGFNFLRIDHPAPFSGIKYWEVGNEEYGSWEIDHHGTPGPGGVSTGAQHDPATYAAFAKAVRRLRRRDRPQHQIIGIDSGDPTGASDNNWTKNVLTQGLAIGFVPGFISDHSYMQGPGRRAIRPCCSTRYPTPAVSSTGPRDTRITSPCFRVRLAARHPASSVMATEFNSVYTNPGKQSTSLVNGLFIADSIGSLLDSGYTGGFVWDLRNGWGTSDNNSPSLYGWRQGGDYGLLGDPNTSDPPSTGPYVPYPSYFAEQLASKIVQAGGQVVSASSNYQDLDVYAVLEARRTSRSAGDQQQPRRRPHRAFQRPGFHAQRRRAGLAVRRSAGLRPEPIDHRRRGPGLQHDHRDRQRRQLQLFVPRLFDDRPRPVSRHGRDPQPDCPQREHPQRGSPEAICQPGCGRPVRFGEQLGSDQQSRHHSPRVPFARLIPVDPLGGSQPGAHDGAGGSITKFIDVPDAEDYVTGNVPPSSYGQPDPSEERAFRADRVTASLVD